jgi:hypothetical protein
LPGQRFTERLFTVAAHRLRPRAVCNAGDRLARAPLHAARGGGRVPGYMDRHNIPTATSEDLARAHESNLAVQDEYGTKFLTSWFDPTGCAGI